VIELDDRIGPVAEFINCTFATRAEFGPETQRKPG
jgi:hypothetical protein